MSASWIARTSFRRFGVPWPTAAEKSIWVEPLSADGGPPPGRIIRHTHRDNAPQEVRSRFTSCRSPLLGPCRFAAPDEPGLGHPISNRAAPVENLVLRRSLLSQPFHGTQGERPRLLQLHVASDVEVDGVAQDVERVQRVSDPECLIPHARHRLEAAGLGGPGDAEAGPQQGFRSICSSPILRIPGWGRRNAPP